MELDPAEDGKTATVRIEPFRPEDSRISIEPGVTILELPKYPTVANVRLGDTVALDLLVNRATGQKVVDYLTLRRHGEMATQQKPRDFLLTDVEFSLLGPEIFVNGRPAPSGGGGGFTGAVIWIYVPGHGRFVLSLLPNESLGFVRNGIVSNNGLLFHDGPTEVRVNCNSPIAPGSGVYNLYVLRQRGWRPGDPSAWMIGAADRPDFVLGRK